ncbi:MAG: TetR/AcrR family transcriptional regulator [Rhizobium sp.]|nr:MAG: TetR/AcrR family transcriptional regulator [Rhizobium sp.]
MPAKSVKAAAKLPHIHDGVFFNRPAVLRRGRHNLKPEQVASAQRERILAAVTELLAAKGYKSFGAVEIARHAGVSLQAFYACFKNKDDCVFAGYDRFIKILLKRMAAVKIADVKRGAIVHSLVGAYLETLQSDLVVARAYQVEIDALGAPARERRRKSLTLFASHIKAAMEQPAPRKKQSPELPWSSYLGVVYAVRQLASDALDAEPEPDLNLLREDVEIWIADLYRQR